MVSNDKACAQGLGGSVPGFGRITPRSRDVASQTWVVVAGRSMNFVSVASTEVDEDDRLASGISMLATQANCSPCWSAKVGRISHQWSSDVSRRCVTHMICGRTVRMRTPAVGTRAVSRFAGSGSLFLSNLR